MKEDTSPRFRHNIRIHPTSARDGQNKKQGGEKKRKGENRKGGGRWKRKWICRQREERNDAPNNLLLRNWDSQRFGCKLRGAPEKGARALRKEGLTEKKDRELGLEKVYGKILGPSLL